MISKCHQESSFTNWAKLPVLVPLYYWKFLYAYSKFIWKKFHDFKFLGLLIEYFLAHFIPKIFEWTSLINYIKIFSVSKILSGVTQLNTVTILNQILNKHNKTTKEPTTTKNKHIKYQKENNQMPQLFFFLKSNRLLK